MADQTPQSYFARFYHFVPNPSAPLQQEFNRLADSKGWVNQKYKQEKRKCFLNEYDLHVGTVGRGTSSEKLAKMQELCVELGIDPVPVSITACRKALKKIHVNIIDLLDARRRRVASADATLDAALRSLNLNNDPTAVAGSGQPVKVTVFKHIGQLQQYTRKTGKFFPREKAKKEGALSCLLRAID